ncbi:MAG: restriction endonuclease subunit S [Candidatus Cloacimonetes bacterium]|nr:restriction endonuclease subunit S [Candidatus Cloacimonadota bacterium]
MLELGDLIQNSSIHKSKIIFCSDLNIKYGVSIPAKKRLKGKYLLYSSNGITDHVNVANSIGTSIIFGCRGTVGTSFYSYKDCFVLNTAMYFTVPKNKLGNYFFSIREAKGFINVSTGAAQPQITLDNLKKSILRISINNEQNNILEKIDEMNEKLRILKKYKEQLLNKYF